jgi:hypothetical protein
LTFDRTDMVPVQSAAGPQKAEGYFREAGSTSTAFPETWKTGKTVPAGIVHWLTALDIVEARLRALRAAQLPNYQCHEYPNPSWCRVCKLNYDKKTKGPVLPGVADLKALPEKERIWYVEYRVRHNGTLYMWPGGTRHYYTEHACMPSLEFYNLINKFAVLATQNQF